MHNIGWCDKIGCPKEIAPWCPNNLGFHLHHQKILKGIFSKADNDFEEQKKLWEEKLAKREAALAEKEQELKSKEDELLKKHEEMGEANSDKDRCSNIIVKFSREELKIIITKILALKTNLNHLVICSPTW